MSIRPHQDQLALVGFVNCRLIKRYDVKRNARARGRAGNVFARWGMYPKSQKYKSASVKIERRTPVAQPHMRRARARAGGLRVGFAFEWGCRRAVRYNDR